VEVRSSIAAGALCALTRPLGRLPAAADNSARRSVGHAEALTIALHGALNRAFCLSTFLTSKSFELLTSKAGAVSMVGMSAGQALPRKEQKSPVLHLEAIQILVCPTLTVKSLVLMHMINERLRTVIAILGLIGILRLCVTTEGASR
jgi:hypothetical protein